MLKIARWLGVVVFVLLVLLIVLARTARFLPEHARFNLDLTALRAVAGPDDALPVQARAEEVARADFPALGVVVGEGFKSFTFGFFSWQLVYADGSTAVIEAVHSKQKHLADYSGFPYRDEGWAHQERALLAAKAIAVTHEHHDHIGGLVDSAHLDALGPKLKLTAAQRARPPFGGSARAIGGAPTLESGPEGSLHPIAPGVVAITAAGHTPGSQMIYVRLKDHRELLLIGDIAWSHLNLDKERPRPRLTSLVMGEDAGAVVHQLRAILEFKRQNPTVDVVVSHDIPDMEARFKSGAVVQGLQ